MVGKIPILRLLFVIPAIVLIVVLIYAVNAITSVQKGLSFYATATHSDSQNIAVVGESTITILDSNLMVLHFRDDFRSAPSGENTVDVSWNAVGNQVVYATDVSSVGIWDLNTDTKIPLVGASFPISWSPLGNTIASGGEQNTLLIWDRDSVEIVSTIPSFTYGNEQYPDIANSMEWNPDGSLLAVRYSSGRIRIWDIETEDFIYTDDSDASSICWLTTNQLVIASHSQNIQIWDEDTNSIGRTIPAMASAVVCSHSNNQLLLTSGDTLQLWNDDTSTLTSRFAYSRSKVTDISLEESGNSIIMVTVDGEVEMVTAETSDIIQSVTLPSSE